MGMQEAILERYESLQKQYAQLSNDKEKQDFKKHYASFIKLALSIEKKRDHLNQKFSKAFMEQELNILGELKYAWRTMFLQYFGREYEDDCLYRDALATGNLNLSNLSKIKLLIPIKWLCFAIQTLYLILTTFILHFFNSLMRKLMTLLFGTLFEIISSKKSKLNTLKNIAKSILYLLPLLALITLPTLLFLFFPITTLMLFSLPLLIRTLNCLANPVNEIARPCAHYFKLNPYLSTALMLVVAAALMIATIGLSYLLPLMTILTVSSYISSGLVCLALANFFYRLYKILDPLEFKIIFPIMLVSSLTGVLMTLLIPGATVVIDAMFYLGNIATNVSTMIIFYEMIQMLSKGSSLRENRLVNLPRPSKAIPENIKEATNLGQKRALASDRLFHSGKEASVVRQDTRTKTWRSLSFFGGGQQPVVEPKFSAARDLKC